MKKSQINLLFLLFFGLMANSLQAQFEDVIKYQVNEALQAHMQGVSPQRGCDLDAARFNYANSMKIERSQKIDGVLRVWGKAKTSYKSQYHGAGNKVVEFYAEVKRIEVGQFEVVKLRWKTAGNCMKMTTLMEK